MPKKDTHPEERKIKINRFDIAFGIGMCVQFLILMVSGIFLIFYFCFAHYVFSPDSFQLPNIPTVQAPALPNQPLSFTFNPDKSVKFQNGTQVISPFGLIAKTGSNFYRGFAMKANDWKPCETCFQSYQREADGQLSKPQQLFSKNDTHDIGAIQAWFWDFIPFISKETNNRLVDLNNKVVLDRGTVLIKVDPSKFISDKYLEVQVLLEQLYTNTFWLNFQDAIMIGSIIWYLIGANLSPSVFKPKTASGKKKMALRGYEIMNAFHSVWDMYKDLVYVVYFPHANETVVVLLYLSIIVPFVIVVGLFTMGEGLSGILLGVKIYFGLEPNLSFNEDDDDASNKSGRITSILQLTAHCHNAPQMSLKLFDTLYSGNTMTSYQAMFIAMDFYGFMFKQGQNVGVLNFALRECQEQGETGVWKKDVFCLTMERMNPILNFFLENQYAMLRRAFFVAILGFINITYTAVILYTPFIYVFESDQTEALKKAGFLPKWLVNHRIEGNHELITVLKYGFPIGIAVMIIAAAGYCLYKRCRASQATQDDEFYPQH